MSTQSLRRLAKTLSQALSCVSLLLLTILLGAGAALAVNPPTISPTTGTYSTLPATATMTADPGCTIYYTLTGAVPTTSSSVYSTPVPLTLPATVKAIAWSSGISSSITSSYIDGDTNTRPVPRTGLKLWLRGSFGPIVSGSNVTNWIDMSGNSPGNDASQSTSGNHPTIVSSAVNGLPGVNFSGSSQYMSLTSGLSDLTAGLSIFAVLNPLGTGTATLLSSGNSGPSDLVSVQTINTQAKLNAYNSTTASSLTSSSGALTVGNFQILSVVHGGSGTANLSVNSTNVGTGSVQNLNNVSRTQNYIGADNAVSSFWNGQLAELLIYNRPVTSAEQADIESFLFGRYQVATAQSTPAPIISVSSSTLDGPTLVAISSRPQDTVRITMDGTTPNSSSPTYTRPLNIYYSQTLKAISISNGISSSVSSATYVLDSTRWPAPDPSDNRPLEINLQLPTTAIPD